MRCLDFADLAGNGVAKTTLMAEMYQKRRKLQRSDYMRRFQDYVSARAEYVQKYRRLRDSRPLAATPMDLNQGLEYCQPRVQPSSYMPVSVARPPSTFAHPRTHHYSDRASSSSFMSFSPTAIVAQQSVAYVSGPHIRTPFAAPTTRQNAYVRGLNVSFGDIW